MWWVDTNYANFQEFGKQTFWGRARHSSAGRAEFVKPRRAEDCDALPITGSFEFVLIREICVSSFALFSYRLTLNGLRDRLSESY